MDEGEEGGKVHREEQGTGFSFVRKTLGFFLNLLCYFIAIYQFTSNIFFKFLCNPIGHVLN